MVKLHISGKKRRFNKTETAGLTLAKETQHTVSVWSKGRTMMGCGDSAKPRSLIISLQDWRAGHSEITRNARSLVNFSKPFHGGPTIVRWVNWFHEIWNLSRINMLPEKLEMGAPRSI
jgi:hypothetical protein